jgi:ABC-type uncharacterized transport system substrate-binding protein
MCWTALTLIVTLTLGGLTVAVDVEDKMLKGAKLGDLPVQQPTKFDLAINLKMAKILGPMISQSLVQRADHVIR